MPLNRSEQGSTYNTYSRPQQNSASVSGPSLWVYVDRAALTYAPCSLHLRGQLDRTADAKAACERSHDRKTNRLWSFVPYVRDFFFRRPFTFGSIFRTKLPFGTWCCETRNWKSWKFPCGTARLKSTAFTAAQ